VSWPQEEAETTEATTAAMERSEKVILTMIGYCFGRKLLEIVMWIKN
jgi:hypothetical protein